MKRTKAQALEGLEDGVLPIVPITKTFNVRMPDGKQKKVSRTQLPMTPAYAFTDYRAQA
ncbi:hypothetical protein EDC04DRAFT_2574403 [Pisolithus marmoratus]|nr:hypothetical protein EDC04DRAFT_2574403 [Pisolithus marmoratus]